MVQFEALILFNLQDDKNKKFQGVGDIRCWQVKDINHASTPGRYFHMNANT